MFKLAVHTALPLFILTCLVSTTTGVISWTLSILQRCGSGSFMPRPRWDELARVVLLGFMQGCEFGFLNKSLEGLSVTESTMLQNINVLFMMITAWLCDLESLTIVRVCAGMLLAAGGMLQGLASSGHHASAKDGDAHLWGLVCMVISMLLTSLKWSLIQFMTQLSLPASFLGQLSKLQLAALVQPITGCVCFMLALIFEWDALCNFDKLVTLNLLMRVPVIAVGITMISCSELKVVELTSAVACGILINLHHIPMVMAGIIALHDTIDAQSIVGFALCVCGGIIYAYSRYLDKKAGSH
uniref:Sugar phosphate transporter domain-containing protein n=1 Tax=Alexandrium monilatum TaxID=311494 RepID=A0A7S4VWG1_9DINO